MENKNGIKHSQVFKDLLSLITEGHFRPGEILSERELAEKLNVSRTPIREALRKLEKEGIIVYTPRKGVTIANITVEQVKQLYIFRETLEGLAARLMAGNINNVGELELMGEAIKEAEEAVTKNDIYKLSQINSRFHAAMAEGSGNVYLENALSTIRSHVSMVMSTSLSHTARPPENIKEHKAIYEAIACRDPDLAEAVARAHIRNALSAATLQIISKSRAKV
ncbi:MAG: GntR family transcriptional regulator [Bacillota bacterium]